MDKSITDLLHGGDADFIVRLVAESGGIMNGGEAQIGRLGVARASRSVTITQAWNRRRRAPGSS